MKAFTKNEYVMYFVDVCTSVPNFIHRIFGFCDHHVPASTVMAPVAHCLQDRVQPDRAACDENGTFGVNEVGKFMRGGANPKARSEIPGDINGEYDMAA